MEQQDNNESSAGTRYNLNEQTFKLLARLQEEGYMYMHKGDYINSMKCFHSMFSLVESEFEKKESSYLDTIEKLFHKKIKYTL